MLNDYLRYKIEYPGFINKSDVLKKLESRTSLEDNNDNKQSSDSLKDAAKREIYYMSAGWNNKMFVKTDLMPHHIMITNVNVERLQDCSDDDILKEGVQFCANCKRYTILDCDEKHCFKTPREAFAALIDKVSGKGTWNRNPWVFVYEFKLID